MADNNRQTEDRLISAYKSSSSLEQSLFQLLSVVYEPVSGSVVVNCLSRAGIKGDNGRRLEVRDLNRLLAKFQAAGLLDENFRCRAAVVEIATRDAVASGIFGSLAKAVQDELPLSLSSYSKRAQRCWRVMRELRIGIYSHDLAHIENLRPFLSALCEEIIGTPAPAVQVCVNPFQSSWFKTLPASLQLYLLNLIFSYALQHLAHFEGPARYLIEEEGFVSLLAEERLPFHRLLANYLLWQGRLDDLGKLVARAPSSFSASGFAGCIDFLRGDNASALEKFEADLKHLRKRTGQPKIYFHGIAGVLFILALWKSENVRQVGRIGEFIAAARAERQAVHLKPVYACLAAVLAAQRNEVEEAEEILAGVTLDYGIAALFAVLARCWLDDSLSSEIGGHDLVELLGRFWRQAEAGGFRWLALECAEILSRRDNAEPLYQEYVAQIRQETGIASIISSVRLKSSWERNLRALIRVTSSLLSEDASVVHRKNRLVWRVSYENKCLTISPREQKKRQPGEWSKGRPVALGRLYAGSGLVFLTEQDRKVCGFIRREHSNNKIIYRIDYGGALPALVGHPFLFLEGAQMMPVEFVKGDPELFVEETDGQLLIKFSREISGTGVTVARETATRFRIIEINDKHRRIARIIGANGLRAPISASDKVMAAIGNISAFMTVHSAVATGAAGYRLADITEVKADAKIHIQLMPLGSGFKLKMFVKPFVTEGPYLKPGRGAKNVMAEIGGRRLNARRNLELETENARRVETACPVLAISEEIDREWHLPELRDCLQALDELNEIREFVVIEWPEGEKITISHRASFDQLAVRIRQKNDWFELEGKLELDEGLVLEMSKMLMLSRENPGRFLPLGDGRFLALTREFQRRLEELDVFSRGVGGAGGARGVGGEPEGMIRVHPLVVPVLEDFVADLKKLDVDEGWDAQLRLLQEVREIDPSVPSTLQAELRGYQVEGYVWLKRLAYWGVGACLADDMGLGKTLQALAIILDRTAHGPTLVVAPTSVCMNWNAEIERFAPTLKVCSLEVRGRKKQVASFKEFDILVTSYTMLQQEAELLASITWQTIVLDEAQAIKNMATKRSKAAMGLKGKFRLLATGTPIENHLGELWNLFNFINPGLLGGLADFNERFAVPIERYRDRDVGRKLRRLIAPFILRRLKSQVLEELPPRTEIVLHVEMSKEEAAFYDALRRRALDNLRGVSNRSGQNMQILAEIMRLRLACCNARLVDANCEISSAKLELFGKVVDELMENRHKVLVFSQFVGHLKIIREYLDAKGLDYRYLDGATPVRERALQVEAFQAGRGDLFLISMKAGGLGLNLTAADYVIHMDPWWNPAVEDQASDRAHRIGQNRPVTIYRLVTSNTIEEKIVKLHQEKRELADSLLEGSDLSARISLPELFELIKGE